MFAQRSFQRGEWFDFSARPVFGFRAVETRHQLVDVFELGQRGPAAITATPLRTWREPDGEGLGEVFRRMCLCVPRRQVQHKLPAARLGFVKIRVGLCKRAEELAILALEVKPESRVEGVAGFVTQNPQAFGVSAAFDLQHLLPLQLHQTRVREVKRDGDARHPIWRKPLFCQPNMRFKPNSTGIQLAVQPLDVGLEKRPLDLNGKVADAQVK